MKQSLALRTGLSLTMTPALQQAIRLLQLSSLDLQLEIQQALDSNVMLENAVDEPMEEVEEEQTEQRVAETATEAAVDVVNDAPIPEDMPVDADWSDIYDGGSYEGSGSGTVSADNSDDLYDFLQANQHVSTSLREHLNWQASIAPFDEINAGIALNLIDAVNDDGYLEDWDALCERLSNSLEIEPARVEEILAAVQDFDPPGVAARDLCECLRLQLQQYPPTLAARSDALQLLNVPMTLIACRDAATLAQASGLPRESVPAALELITSLQPHPGRPYQAHESDYIAPDVFVTKREGRWRVTLNPEHMPKLRINSYYQGMIKRADTSRDQLTMKQHLQEARYFINSLEARNETLLRVAHRIVEEQRAFLEYGEEAMRPLVLRDVSEQIGVHESTVSRATANKYMQTPRGLYELKYFFSSHVQTTQGGTCSATAIQAMIKRLIAEEVPAKPLSDSTLSEMLLKDGIQVARRTVAKYREGLRIPPSHERKPMV